jgi:hypothetical protein
MTASSKDTALRFVNALLSVPNAALQQIDDNIARLQVSGHQVCVLWADREI